MKVPGESLERGEEYEGAYWFISCWREAAGLGTPSLCEYKSGDIRAYGNFNVGDMGEVGGEFAVDDVPLR